MQSNWRALSRSTIARFIALTFLSQLVVTGGALFFVWRSSAATLLAEQQALVTELRDDLVAGFGKGGVRELLGLIDARLQSAELTLPVILLVRSDGKILAGNLDAWPAEVPTSSAWRTVTLYRSRSEYPEAMGIVTTPLPGRFSLLTGHIITSSIRLRNLNQEALLSAVFLSLPLGLLLAMLLGRTINARIRSVAATAEAVASGDLSRRVDRDGSGDSFDALGHGVNVMLDQIEMLVGELRIVTDSLAHDLRSPITRLKSTIERAILDTKDIVARNALEKVSAEAETLLAMLATALQISRAEAGIGRDRFTEIDVGRLLADLVEIYGPLAEDDGVTLSAIAPDGMIVKLHRELLSQALGNLIENALKYARGNQRIVIAAAPSPTGIVLSVADNGPGIPVERRTEALKKFGRLDASRTISGSGLGLSLVDAVARLHRGQISLEDNAPGLKVLVTVRG